MTDIDTDIDWGSAVPTINLWEPGAGWEGLRMPYDVCIVGTGPAGATLARELSGTSLRVCLLESGDVHRRPEVDLLTEVESVGRARVDNQWAVRNRIVGGSSHTWGGRCAPFDRIDFEKRPWVPASGWPFPAEHLTPYLDRSASYLGLAMGTGFTGEEFWEVAGRRRPSSEADPSLVLPFFWQFSRDVEESYPFEYTRFGRGLAGRLGTNVTLVTGATVLRVDPTESGDAVRSVQVATLDGRRHEIEAATVVLCTGGIENARLLLSSDSVTPEGLGNQHGLVGRYLMDHPRGDVGVFDPTSSRALQKRLGRYNVQGHFFRAGFRLSPEVQRAEQLLNCSAWLHEEWADDDPWSALRRMAGGRPRRQDLVAVLANLGLIGRGARDYFIERNGVPRKLAGLSLRSMVEQRPDPDSRVTLSDRRDAFGMRLPRLDWRIHEDEARTVRRMAMLLAEELPRLGFPAPVLAAWVRDAGEVPAEFSDAAHPTGTTRMSTDPVGGVVDADSAVHGVDGLFVTGSSVFPTAGHCNPTQMIVAMAIRLGDHLKQRAAASTAVDLLPATAGTVPPTKVLLTGGTGRIGRVVLDDLLSRGYSVRATTSRPVTAGDPGCEAVEWRRFDFLEATEDDYDTLVEGCHAVLHLAAEIGNMARMPRVNTDATRWLAEAAERAHVAAFCYTSTVSVYGSGRRRTAAEDAPVLTLDRDVPSEYLAMDYVRAYGRTKLAGEVALASAARTSRYVVLRPTVVVGAEDIAGIRDWDRTKRVLAAHRHAHHVYVGDVSDVLIWGMERALAGVVPRGGVETYNVSEDDFAEPTHSHFMRKARAVSGDSRFSRLRVPGVFDWAHDVLRFRSLSFRNPLWRMRFPSDRLQAAGYRHRFGMAHAHALALEQVRAHVDQARSDKPETSPATGYRDDGLRSAHT